MALTRFVKEVYAPGLHLAYAAAWFLGLEGAFVFLSGAERWKLGLHTMLGVLTLFMTLFFLRAVDEWKDLDYDRVYNPDRPLVQGGVTLRQLWGYMAVTAVLVVAVNAWVSWKLAGIVLADMGWGVFLVWLERVSTRVRDGMMVNLLVTYPVNVALSVYTCVLASQTHGVSSGVSGGLLVVAFAFAFLHYELSRKIAWPHLTKATERLYSRELGPHAAIGAAFGCALVACGLVVHLFLERGAPLWGASLVLAALVAAVLGLRRFLRERAERCKLKPLATLFLAGFYVSLCVQAFGVNRLSWSVG
ncbi:MAG: hypothetical protein WCI05_19450 [Myxococcales bacterium]